MGFSTRGFITHLLFLPRLVCCSQPVELVFHIQEDQHPTVAINMGSHKTIGDIAMAFAQKTGTLVWLVAVVVATKKKSRLNYNIVLCCCW
jgi:hypothetical protein